MKTLNIVIFAEGILFHYVKLFLWHIKDLVETKILNLKFFKLSKK